MVLNNLPPGNLFGMTASNLGFIYVSNDTLVDSGLCDGLARQVPSEAPLEPSGEGMKMRVGIVGLGTIGRTLCQAIDRRDVEVELVAVSTRHHE
jgi:hypothetical protein